MRDLVVLVAGTAFVLYGSISTFAAPRGSSKRRMIAIQTWFGGLLTAALMLPRRATWSTGAVMVPLLIAMGWLIYLWLTTDDPEHQ